MEEQLRPHYPLGYQYFQEIRERGFLYVDKTDFVYKMTHEDSKYVLLTRPRVFGKTLFVTTLKSYFEGKKDLFKGLKIEKLEKDWTEYPVMHFTFNILSYVDSRKYICSCLNFRIRDFHEIYGGNKNETSPSERLRELIKRAYLKTGKKVVVLLDEYDTPFSEARFVQRTDLGPVTEIFGDFFQTLKGTSINSKP